MVLGSSPENSEVRKKHLDKLGKVLYSQEYPQNLIQEAIQKVTSLPTENLIKFYLVKIKIIVVIWKLLQLLIQIIKTL